MEIRHIHKSYRNLDVLRDINFAIEPGSFCSILGPSGCGKSTLLNILAGIEAPTGGEFLLDDPGTLSYCLQESVLLPWRTLYGNIRLSAEIEGLAERQTTDRIHALTERFGLAGFEDYYPGALSGGMKQRASLIRSLITKPRTLLMDEPFHSLDFDVKLRIQRELLQYQKENSATILMITHDIEDAIAMSDRIVVLTAKPTIIKAILPVDLGLAKKDPVEARSSRNFADYFALLWKTLKYLDN